MMARICPMCSKEMEKIETEETSWWECEECGILPSRDDAWSEDNDARDVE